MTFYVAEDYHQDYHKKNPVRYKFYRYNCGRDARLSGVGGRGDALTPLHHLLLRRAWRSAPEPWIDAVTSPPDQIHQRRLSGMAIAFHGASRRIRRSRVT